MKAKATRILGALGMTLALAATPFTATATSLAGAYLAANQANRDNNYDAAARYYTLALTRDPNSPFLLQNALLTYVAKGDVKRSTAIARKIADGPLGSQLADLVLLSDAIKEEDYSKAAEILQKGEQRFSPLLFELLSGWVQLGQGQITATVKRFDAMTSPKAMQLFGQYHKALALAVVGDFETADKILQGGEDGNLRINRGSLIAHAEILTQLDRSEEALEILNKTLRGTTDPSLLHLRDRIVKNGVVDYDFITNAREGAAEVFFTLSSVLNGEENDRYSLIYARLSEYLRPGYSEAVLLTAEILKDQKQYDLATETYASLSPDDPMFVNAEIGRADALEAAEKFDAAIEVLQNLARGHGDIPRVHMSLGDVFRGLERYEEAAEAYTRAIELIPEPAQNHWFLFYARGITNERTGNWDKAEADFKKALELSPDQPLVLNYYGYSLVEKHQRLDEAQKMIEKAVAARPTDGYITDSLGWIFYTIGKYDQAVGPMERAVELVPLDPIISDHLGDVYWMVGRKREAKFQWRRALSFKPDEKDAVRMRRKLEVGLDQVLKEEAAKDGN